MIDWKGKKTMHIIFRHAEKVVGEDYTNEAPNYPMITKLGEAQTRAAAVGLFEVIKSAPEGSVAIFCGCSKAARTQSTLAVLANEVHRLCWRKEFITLSLPERADVLLRSFSQATANLFTKVVVEYPMVLKNFISSGQDDAQIATEMLGELKRMEAVFRLFFPEKFLFLVSVGHSQEMGLCVQFLGGLVGEESDARAAQESAHFRFLVTTPTS